MIEALRNDLDQEDCEFLKQLSEGQLQGMFWGSVWNNAEAEEIARQTLKACGINFSKHGTAFSWLGTGARACSGNGLVNNLRGLCLLIDYGYLIQEDAPEGLPAPDLTVMQEGKPQVLRITKKHMAYARAEFKK